MLRDVSLHYWMPPNKPHVVENMLETATKLESFESYKLCSNRVLSFASPVLTKIDLHRSDTLEFVSIWAPRLTSLRLEACSMDDIEFLATHPLAASLPAGFVCRKPLRVMKVYSTLGTAAKNALSAHPRAGRARSRNYESEDEE